MRLPIAGVVLLLLGCAAPAADFSYAPYSTQPDAWFASDEGRRIADNLLSYQLPNGSWSKGIDMAADPHRPGERQSIYEGDRGTFDNNATIAQMCFLARAYDATADERYRDAFLRGLDYILASQYPSGGWPQVYPLLGGYNDYATFNDHAMTRVMELLRDVGAGRFPFADAERQERLKHAFDRGLNYILRAQIKVDGRLTAWCQQHDPLTYEPRPGRSYEHVSLVSGESAGVLMLLASLPDAPAVRRALQAGADWLRQVRIDGYRRGEVNGLQSLVADPGAHVWARFYEIGTNRPIFSDHDGVIKYSIEEIGRERRSGYAWYTNAPDRLLALLEDTRE